MSWLALFETNEQPVCPNEGLDVKLIALMARSQIICCLGKLPIVPTHRDDPMESGSLWFIPWVTECRGYFANWNFCHWRQRFLCVLTWVLILFYPPLLGVPNRFFFFHRGGKATWTNILSHISYKPSIYPRGQGRSSVREQHWQVQPFSDFVLLSDV